MFNLLKYGICQPAQKTDPEFAVKSDQDLADMAKPLVEQLSRIASEFARRGYDTEASVIGPHYETSGLGFPVKTEVAINVVFGKRETKSFSV